MSTDPVLPKASALRSRVESGQRERRNASHTNRSNRDDTKVQNCGRRDIGDLPSGNEGLEFLYDSYRSQRESKLSDRTRSTASGPVPKNLGTTEVHRGRHGRSDGLRSNSLDRQRTRRQNSSMRSGTRYRWESTSRQQHAASSNVGQMSVFDRPNGDFKVADAIKEAIQRESSVQAKILLHFAAALLDRMEPFEPDNQSKRLLATALEQFSIMMAPTATSWSTEHIIALIYRERHLIAWALCRKLMSNNSQRREDRAALKSTLTALAYKFSTSAPDAYDYDYLDFDYLDLSIRNFPLPYVRAGKITNIMTFLTASKHFQSLLSWNKIAVSTLPTASTSTRVRQEIARAIRDSESRDFSFQWDPTGFLRAQYDLDNLPSLDNLLCLVGSGNDVEMMTCAHYVARMWPNIGLETLKALDSFFAGILADGEEDQSSKV